MANKIVVWMTMIALFLVMLCPVQALYALNGNQTDEIGRDMIDSINNNYYSFETIIYNDTWTTNIHYTDTALDSLNPDVAEINKAGAFALSYVPFHNNGNTSVQVGIPDAFDIVFTGVGSTQTWTCENFTLLNKCIVYYKITNKETYNDNSSYRVVYQEEIIINSVGIPFNISNLTFSVFQFESPEGMTFREKAMSNMTGYTMTIQRSTVLIVDKFGKVVDWMYEILLMFYWMLKIGLIISALFLVFAIPLKFVDLIIQIKKKYGSKERD